MTLQPTALVHEAWIRLSGKMDRTWESRDHFLNAAALTMRRILTDRARQKATLKHGGGGFSIPPPVDAPDLSADERLLLIDECLKRFEAENPEDSRIVVLKFFAGLTNQEVADSLGVNEKTVRRKWLMAKARLYQILTEIENLHEKPAAS